MIANLKSSRRMIEDRNKSQPTFVQLNGLLAGYVHLDPHCNVCDRPAAIFWTIGTKLMHAPETQHNVSQVCCTSLSKQRLNIT